MSKHLKFFKNALVYTLSRDVHPSTFDLMKLHDLMMPLKFTPCGSQDMARTGWKFEGDTPDILHRTTDVLLSIVTETKNLPNAVLQKHLREKVEKLELEQGRKLKKTEKDALKDEVLHTLLPRAFSTQKISHIWIDVKSSRIVVDAGSAKQAEDALAFLRKTLGSLPVVPLTMENPIELTLTEWVRGGAAPQGFALLEEAELKAVLEDGGSASVKKQDLVSDEIATHLAAGKLVTKLALDWEKRVTFLLDDRATFKRLKFCDELTEQNDDIDTEEDAEARRYADFMLMCDELRTMIDATVVALGGEAKR